MNSGPRNRKIAVERATYSTNSYNEKIPTWSPFWSGWAEVRFSKGGERREAAQEKATAAATFIVLADSKTSAVTPMDRIQFDGAAWEIRSNIPSREYNAGREIEAIRQTS